MCKQWLPLSRWPTAAECRPMTRCHSHVGSFCYLDRTALFSQDNFVMLRRVMSCFLLRFFWKICKMIKRRGNEWLNNQHTWESYRYMTRIGKQEWCVKRVDYLGVKSLLDSDSSLNLGFTSLNLSHQSFNVLQLTASFPEHTRVFHHLYRQTHLSNSPAHLVIITHDTPVQFTRAPRHNHTCNIPLATENLILL